MTGPDKKKLYPNENIKTVWDEEKIFDNLEKLTSQAGLDQLMK